MMVTQDLTRLHRHPGDVSASLSSSSSNQRLLSKPKSRNAPRLGPLIGYRLAVLQLLATSLLFRDVSVWMQCKDSQDTSWRLGRYL